MYEKGLICMSRATPEENGNDTGTWYISRIELRTERTGATQCIFTST
jgi:hypothetical protein